MKLFANTFLLSLVLVLSGCGGTSSNSTVTENADEAAKAEYEANMKAQEEAESAAMEAAQ